MIEYSRTNIKFRSLRLIDVINLSDRIFSALQTSCKNILSDLRIFFLSNLFKCGSHCHNHFLLEMKSYYLDISYSKVPWALSRAAPPCRIPPRQNIYSFLSLSPSSCKVNNNHIYLLTYNYIQLYPTETEYILVLILVTKLLQS